MIREINIQPVLNGFLCNVGCQRVVFEGREKLLAELKKYLEDPDGTEHQFIKNAINRMDRPCERREPETTAQSIVTMAERACSEAGIPQLATPSDGRMR